MGDEVLHISVKKQKQYIFLSPPQFGDPPIHSTKLVKPLLGQGVGILTDETARRLALG